MRQVTLLDVHEWWRLGMGGRQLGPVGERQTRARRTGGNSGPMGRRQLGPGVRVGLGVAHDETLDGVLLGNRGQRVHDRAVQVVPDDMG